MTIDEKELYERMDAIFAALPDTAREDFAELVGQVTSISINDMITQRRLVARWRSDHGFPKFE